MSDARHSSDFDMRVLIVEDHFLVAEALRLTLAESGHHVVGVADDADSAVEIAGLHRPDFALVDVQLARGSSGLDAARVMKDRHEIPSLFVTANPEAARSARSVALGCLIKPYTDAEIRAVVSAVEALLRGHPRPSATAAFELY
jgi:DNA-binding response OmpR family regulator